MVHHHDAKAQRDCDCLHCHLLEEEGSENKDVNSNQERGIEEDNVNEEEEGGPQVLPMHWVRCADTDSRSV